MRSRSGSDPFRKLCFQLFGIEWVRGAIMVVLMPSFAISRHGISLSVVGLAVSLHYLTDALIKSLVGYWLDRYPRLVLHAGYALATAGLGLMASANNEWLLIAAACLLGMGLSPVWLICLGRVEEKNRAAQMGVLYVYWLAGLGSGPILIGYAMDLGNRIAFLIVLAFIVSGWALALTTSIPKRSYSLGNIPLKEQLASLVEKMKKARFLLPGMLLQTTAAGILVPVLSTFSTEHLALTHSQFSIVMMAGGASAVIALIPMGKLFDAFEGKWFLVIGFSVFAGALYALSYVETFASVAVISIVMGCAYATLLPAWNAMMARYVPEDSKGMGWGILSSVEGMGVVIGPLIGSWLAGGHRLTLPFLVSSGLFALIGLIYLITPIGFYDKERQTVEVEVRY
ncbi:MFS transporter [Cohnella silvisoli]|uniref:MFS transporter n=1 Tax=Cohnella silvisoli TaxID=2873699 RepID=A0ABV1KT55_9BACL|nr:MFS transporter [Cohnella silvisoli]MCD9021480.1 MFS transporter [Cohnella silvisoli]